MAKRKKTLQMLISVSVPRDMPAAKARKEVRTLINDQSNWHFDVEPGDVKAIAVRAAGKESVK